MRLDQADRIMLGDREVSRVYLGANLVWGNAFSPASLFAQGEPGVWYDPSDFSTLFQDAAGTVPVTAVEQPVGRILDKSGRGFHATQATATSRPVLRQDGSGKHYLYFDGVDDFLVTPTITPGTDRVQVFAGVRKLGTSTATLYEFSGNALGNTGAFALYVDDPISGAYEIGARQSVQYLARTSAAFNSPITNLLTQIVNFEVVPADLAATLRVNSSKQILTQVGGGNMGQGNFLAYPLYIGRRAGTSFPFNGHLYSLVLRFGSNLPIETIEQTEAWINGKTGAY